MNYNATESRVAEWTINGFQKHVSESVLDIQTYLKLCLIYFYFFMFPQKTSVKQTLDSGDTGDRGKSLNGPVFSFFIFMCQYLKIFWKIMNDSNADEH